MTKKNIKTKNRPSRKRYEASHPIVSFRIPMDLYDELYEYIKENKMRKGDFIRIALNKQQADYSEACTKSKEKGFSNGKAIGLKEGNAAGQKEGYDKGKKEAYGTFDLPCLYCEEPRHFDIVKYPNHRKVFEEAFKNWGHEQCQKTKGTQIY